MLYNQANPRIEIDPRTVEIRIDGQPLPPLPDDDLPAEPPLLPALSEEWG